MTLRKPILVLMIAALAMLAGCKKKKPPLPQPAATAPTITAPAETPAATAPATTAPEPEPTKPVPSEPSTTPAPSTTRTTTPHPRTKPSAAHTTTTRKPAAPGAATPATGTAATTGTTTANATAAAPVAPAPAAPAPKPDNTVQIAPGLPHDEAMHRRQTTDQLLQSTEQNLGQLHSPLTVDQQAMVQQIRLYMAQSRTATTDGDLVRAHNLALKAHLLSDEMVK